MTKQIWKIIDHEGNSLQSGFDTKAEAEKWLRNFKKHAKIEEGE